MAVKLPGQPVSNVPGRERVKSDIRLNRPGILAMALAVAATSVSKGPHRRADSAAEREGFGPWASPERIRRDRTKTIGAIRGTDGSNPVPSSGESCKPDGRGRSRQIARS